ncbi:uncharacterized protein LOC123362613 isoform X4 [Mauremys mutica]|uniref:uncharacterized protein LOC123362613 isoform X4 n=1 Tax=Mauremys mutica TaxID=74926 RepID=UPI001D151517|nr:uncharacterized protein LOC123362613 isoform X4 [Mauremys mutica]
MVASPDWNRDAQKDDTALKEKEQSSLAAGARELRLREPLGQITSWSSQTLRSKEDEDESLKYSKYRLGGSVDSVLSLASSEPFDPLERKTLRSKQSQCALARSSSIAQEGTYGRHKPTADITQDIVDDIIGDEVAFKIPVQLISNNNSPGATHSMTSRDIYSQIHTGPASHSEAAYLEHSPDTAPCLLAPCPRSEGLSEAGMPDGQAVILANPQNLLDSDETLMLSETETTASQCSSIGSFAVMNQESPGLNHGIKMIAALSKSAYGSGTSSSADRVSNIHKATETEESQDISVHLLQSLVERAEEINQLTKKVQIENQQQLEEWCLRSAENERFKREQEARSFKEKMATPSHLSLDHSSALILQQQIVSLKNQVGDLLEANEAAVLELANADEEISQLKNEMAQLKSEYLQKIKESKEENNLLKEMMNTVSKRHTPLATYDQDLHEIFQLRRESRRLRELCHQLNEENHRLKEELWDVKREYERLAEMATARKKGQTTTLIPWTDLCKKDTQTRILSSVQYGRKEGLQTDETNGIPSSRMMSILKVYSPHACDERQQECSKSNASSVSMNSESTEILITGYHDTGLKKESKRNTKDGACEEIPEPCDDDLSAVSQQNRTHQNSLQHDADVTTGSLSAMDTCSKSAMSRTPVGKMVLPGRPFAPRNVTDLKVGNLVKFSHPAGKISKGIIKYLGHLLGREDVYLGVELEGSEEGKHDGTFQGTRYYLCSLQSRSTGSLCFPASWDQHLLCRHTTTLKKL